MTFLIIALMIWISITSLNGGGPPEEVYSSWLDTEKMFLMTLVAYTMTNTRERFDQLLLVCVLSLALLWICWRGIHDSDRWRFPGPGAVWHDDRR